jgi:hypothetical protein
MAVRRNCLNLVHSGGTKLFPGGQNSPGGKFRSGTVCTRVPLASPGFASATPNIRECAAIGSSKHQLVRELKMLERRTDATIRKALASNALAAASGTRASFGETRLRGGQP